MTSVIRTSDVWLTCSSKGTQKSFRTSFHSACPAARRPAYHPLHV